MYTGDVIDCVVIDGEKSEVGSAVEETCGDG